VLVPACRRDEQHAAARVDREAEILDAVLVEARRMRQHAQLGAVEVDVDDRFRIPLEIPERIGSRGPRPSRTGTSQTHCAAAAA
jgi:hypothetical protein